jgi:SNF2 family DNA or RNA helicase
VQADSNANVQHEKVELPWAAALSAILQIGQLRREFGFTMEAEGAAEAKLRQFKEERDAVKAARNQTLTRVTPDKLEKTLLGLGFTKRKLRDFQLRDLSKLLSLKHGANFSVPGAGKTTVALALNLLACPPDHAFLVVAPKNAFGAWEQVIEDCLDGSGTAAPFVRIISSGDELLNRARRGDRRFLVSYDRFVRIIDVVSVFLRQVPTHLILDEAHRIKAGELSHRGRAILSVSPLPVRRDILTGTPAPHSLEDLAPQLDFLWPGSGLSRRTIEAPMPRDVLAPFYVRTTKHELNLTPPVRDFVHIEMGPAQLALYSLLRSEALRQLAGIRNNKPAVDIIRARRCVMRLLQASTNPIAAVAAFEQRGSGPDGQLSRLFEAVTGEGDSNKLLRTVEFCDEQKRLGRKVVVWTIFKHTVARLEALTSHLSSVTIFGETPVGSEDDDDTREGKVKRFHEDRDCWVLIANPAACSEGISLHKVCHDALYVDRSYNAAHYLQSIDRIHRLGLEPGVETRITIFQSVAPNKIGSIDHSVSRRLLTKMRAMERILDDEDIRQLALDEEEAAPPVDRDITLDDLADLLEQLTAQTIPAEEEQI